MLLMPQACISPVALKVNFSLRIKQLQPRPRCVVQIAFLLEIIGHLPDANFDGVVHRIDNEVRVHRYFIRGRDSREILDFARARLGVQSLDVALFAFLHRAIQIDLDKVALPRHGIAYSIALVIIRADESSDHNQADSCSSISKVLEAAELVNAFGQMQVEIKETYY